MATEKTPTHKRIKRAESGREDWKVKALERRDENQRLKSILKSKEDHLTELSALNKEHQAKLNEAEKKITKLENEIDNLKKKHLRL